MLARTNQQKKTPFFRKSKELFKKKSSEENSENMTKEISLSFKYIDLNLQCYLHGKIFKPSFQAIRIEEYFWFWIRAEILALPTSIHFLCRCDKDFGCCCVHKTVIHTRKPELCSNSYSNLIINGSRINKMEIAHET